MCIIVLKCWMLLRLLLRHFFDYISTLEIFNSIPISIVQTVLPLVLRFLSSPINPLHVSKALSRLCFTTEQTIFSFWERWLVLIIPVMVYQTIQTVTDFCCRWCINVYNIFSIIAFKSWILIFCRYFLEHRHQFEGCDTYRVQLFAGQHADSGKEILLIM